MLEQVETGLQNSPDDLCYQKSTFVYLSRDFKETVSLEMQLSLDYAHMRGYLIMFSEVSLALDSLIEEHYKDDEQQEVEDAENGQAAVIRVSLSS